MASISGWAMLIGGMKCGSTTLHRHLAEHPEITPSWPKEPEYLAVERAWQKGPEWYQARFRFDEARHRYALDGSSAYSNAQRHPGVPRRMRQLSGRVRILYVVRDPIARMRSHWLHDAATPWGGDRRGLLSPTYLGASDYSAQLDAYREYFDPRDIHVLSLDDLAGQPAEALRRVCRFLEIDESFQFPAPERRDNVSPATYVRTRAWMRRVWRATPGYAPRRVLRWTTQRVRRSPALRSLMFSTQPAPQPHQWEASARQQLAASMARLNSQWGIDVAKWGF